MPFEQIVTIQWSIFKKVNKGITIWGGVKAQNKYTETGVSKLQLASELSYKHQGKCTTKSEKD